SRDHGAKPMRVWHVILTACLSALLAPLTQAATTINCAASAGGIAFGIYNPLSTLANTSTGTVKVTCNGSGTGSANVTVNVTLSTGSSGSYATRKMFSGVNALDYNIYWSTAYNQIVGDGSGGSVAGSAGPFVVPAGGSKFASGALFSSLTHYLALA